MEAAEDAAELFTEEPLVSWPFQTYMQTHAGKMLTDAMNELFLQGRLELEHLTSISEAFDAAMHRAIRRQAPEDAKLSVDANLAEYQDLTDVGFWKARDPKIAVPQVGALKGAELVVRATL